MTKFNRQDQAYAQAYQTMAEEQALPHAIQIKRAQSLLEFYRQQIRHLLFHYRLWLADAEYKRITGQSRAPRSNPLFTATLRRTIAQYRHHQVSLRHLRLIQADIRRNLPRPDFNSMSEREIYDRLEMTHGIYFAQQVVDEMQKAKTATAKKAA
jgi:hypothetical protein